MSLSVRVRAGGLSYSKKESECQMKSMLLDSTFSVWRFYFLRCSIAGIVPWLIPASKGLKPHAKPHA